ERTLRAAELHLRFALDGPDATEPCALLGRLYASTGRGAEAEPYLLRAVDRKPELLLLLARLAHDRGHEPLAREYSARASRVFRERAEAHLDDPEARLLWANAEVFR